MSDETKKTELDDVFVSTKTNAELKAEIEEAEQIKADLELDRKMKRLDFKLKTKQVADQERQLADRVAEVNARLVASKQELAERDFLQKHCTHRKGGRGHGAVTGGRGTDQNYAIIHHIMPTGKLWMRCQRCGREEWGRDPLTGEKATEGYETFLSYPTDNTASGSTLFLNAGGR